MKTLEFTVFGQYFANLAYLSYWVAYEEFVSFEVVFVVFFLVVLEVIECIINLDVKKLDYSKKCIISL